MANSNDDFNKQGSGLGGTSGAGTGGFGNSGDLGGSAGYGSSGSTGSGASGSGYGSTGSSGAGGSGFGSTGGAGAAGADAETKINQVKDRAGQAANTARERASEFAGTAREKAGELKSSLADKLEQGADRLRNRGGNTSVAGVAGDGSMTMNSGNADQLTSRLAGGMQGTAEWLREADLENMRASVEREVRENPGRSLLVAVGLGYLLGKAFRR